MQPGWPINMDIMNTSHLKYFLAGVFTSAFLLVGVAGVQAQGVTEARQGLNEAALSNGAGFSNMDLPGTIGRIVGVGLSFVGVLFLLLMIYGGITWMMARGNDADVRKAKDLITAAVIGLVIVLAAYAITAYVGGVITSSN